MKKYIKSNKESIYFKDRTGEVVDNSDGCTMTIVSYDSCTNCKVMFNDGTIVDNVVYDAFKKGMVKNPFHPVIYEVGYIGVGVHRAGIGKKGTVVYRTWLGMLRRCYNEAFLTRSPQYANCSVDERWHNFQVFAEWYEQNYNSETMQGFQLDKDILVKGNKVYSPETCCFVPQEINSSYREYSNKNRKNQTGVTPHRRKYKAVFSKKFLGYFDTVNEAFRAYETAKSEYIKTLAYKWKEVLHKNVYDTLINYSTLYIINSDFG